MSLPSVKKVVTRQPRKSGWGVSVGLGGEGIHPAAEVASVYIYQVEKSLCFGLANSVTSARPFKNRRSKVYKAGTTLSSLKSTRSASPSWSGQGTCKGSPERPCRQAASDSEKDAVVLLTHFLFLVFLILNFESSSLFITSQGGGSSSYENIE